MFVVNSNNDIYSRLAKYYSLIHNVTVARRKHHDKAFEDVRKFVLGLQSELHACMRDFFTVDSTILDLQSINIKGYQQ